MSDKIKQPRRPAWPGILAFVSMAASYSLHVLYGRMHWPGDSAKRASADVLDALHLGAFFMAIVALGFAFWCLAKGNRWLGVIALALSIGAILNSLICC